MVQSAGSSVSDSRDVHSVPHRSGPGVRGKLLIRYEFTLAILSNEYSRDKYNVCYIYVGPRACISEPLKKFYPAKLRVQTANHSVF